MEEKYPIPKSEIVETAVHADERREAETPEILQTLIDRDLPTARLGVEATNQNNNTIWLTRAIARKSYRCPSCAEPIDIGSVHVLMRVQSGTRHYDHHHLHKTCSYTEIDYDLPVRIFKDNAKTNKRITKRQARSRSRKSRKLRGK